MRKIFIPILLILSIIFITFYATASSPSGNALFDGFTKMILETCKKGNAGWKSWEEGIRQEIGASLRDLRVSFELLEEEIKGQGIFIVIEIVFTAHYINRGGEKERMVVKRVVGLISELPGLTNTRYVIFSEGRTYLPGWNGKDT